MIQKLFENKILICAGSGGVGKTTVSASLAYAAAASGKKVLVFTIDPSKRLASCLGLNDLSGEEVCVKKFETGELWAAIIDAKKIFDEFVMEHSPDKKTAENLIQNRLYQELSTSLNGSQEFTSLQALYKASRGKEYDLIILDTPPAQHTLDFIEAPRIIFNLFNGPVVDWFVRLQKKKSGISALLNQSTIIALSVLEKLTGSEFLKELQEFFKSVSTFTDKIQATVLGAQALMTNKNTQFVIVCNADDSKLQDAQENVKDFKKRGFQVHHIIVNRVVPDLRLSGLTDKNTILLEEFYFKLKNHSEKQFQKIRADDSRHFKSVTLWKLPQTEHYADELKTLEKLSGLFKLVTE